MSLLTTESVMPFGKYRGEKIESILRRDFGYLCWLRAERRKKGLDDFHPCLHEAISLAAKEAVFGPGSSSSAAYRPSSKNEQGDGSKVATAIKKQLQRIAEIEAESSVIMETRQNAYGNAWGAF